MIHDSPHHAKGVSTAMTSLFSRSSNSSARPLLFATAKLQASTVSTMTHRQIVENKGVVYEQT